MEFSPFWFKFFPAYLSRLSGSETTRTSFLPLRVSLEARVEYLSFKMRYVAAYLLAALGGNDAPQSKDIKKILESVGIEADDTRMEKVISELNGKNVEEVISQGFSKLASVPSGGAVAVASSAAAGGGAAAAAPAAEEKKEEKKEESEESDDDMGFGLFD
ncbi:hypothetical protein AGOR_G00108390 [Albula goreensis]|uniref:Large ribosomal subunit protein P2 n=2 Tax=Albula TaxID=54908 RepID=A0A8T3DKW3_9TELE|nr:hypothetical protein AGOR_G00108390 [Albula goreensis]